MEPSSRLAPPRNSVGPVESTARDHALIDRILYLGSLASKREDIDPFMGTLKQVTSTWDDTAPLYRTDRDSLRNLETTLTQYLLHSDPLREFTLDSLEARAKEKFSAGDRSAATSERSFWAILLAASAAAFIGLAFPPYTSHFSERSFVGVPFFFLALHIGIAWLYLTALKQFNQKLHRAFIWLCTGIALLSLGFSHYIILQIFHLDTVAIFRYGGMTWLLGLPFLCMYVGIRMYAMAIGVKSKITSPLLPILAVVISLTIILCIPHRVVASDFYFTLALCGMSFIPIFALLSACLADLIRRALTPAYAKPMGWLFRYMLLVGVGRLFACFGIAKAGELHGHNLMALIAICGIAPQILLLYTGYSFKKETSQ